MDDPPSHTVEKEEYHCTQLFNLPFLQRIVATVSVEDGGGFLKRPRQYQRPRHNKPESENIPEMIMISSKEMNSTNILQNS